MSSKAKAKKKSKPQRTINLNQLAAAITRRDGKKVSVSIGQVKEVLKCLKAEVLKAPLEVGQTLAVYFRKK